MMNLPASKLLIDTGLQPGRQGQRRPRAAVAASTDHKKPLERLSSTRPVPTRLKPGANERRPHGCETVLLRADAGGQGQANAFTLIELLVVIAIVALMASLMLPALSKARSQAQAIQCVGGLKQLQLAWTLYAHDNDDKLVPECVNSPSPASTNLYWAQGFLSFDGSNPDNTNTALLLDQRFALLGSYIRAAGIYKCPSDQSQVPLPDRWAPRVRSVVMNLYAGGITLCSSGPLIYWGTQKLQQFVSPPASSSFVFLDEHPDSIGPTYFRLLPDRGPDASFWYDFPGSYHNGRGTLSFADGHVELHRWVDPRTKPPMRYTGYLPVSASSPDNPDIAWLQDHTSLSTAGDVSVGGP